ncbi:hypothetical protein ACP70R_032782 [Stipagrostis hirtigluma subsp. patula]
MASKIAVVVSMLVLALLFAHGTEAGTDCKEERAPYMTSCEMHTCIAVCRDDGYMSGRCHRDQTGDIHCYCYNCSK